MAEGVQAVIAPDARNRCTVPLPVALPAGLDRSVPRSGRIHHKRRLRSVPARGRPRRSGEIAANPVPQGRHRLPSRPPVPKNRRSTVRRVLLDPSETRLQISELRFQACLVGHCTTPVSSHDIREGGKCLEDGQYQPRGLFRSVTTPACVIASGQASFPHVQACSLHRRAAFSRVQFARSC